jgi:hypothetical protein
MKLDRKENQAVAVIVLWPTVAALLCALLLVGGQVVYWLRYGVMPSLDLFWVFNQLDLEVPRFSWAGVQKIFDWIASLPLPLTIAMFGVAWAALCIALINASKTEA